MSVRNLPPAGVVVLALLAAGCGPRTTTVTGRVVYKGKPVLSGNVAVVGSDNISRTAAIGPDGTFTLENVPTGPCKFGVNSPNPNPEARTEAPGKGKVKDSGSVLGGKRPARGEDRPPPPPGSWFEVPDALLDPLTSGLTAEIRPGEPLILDIP